MEWKQQSHPVERAAISIAGLSLGCASAFALFKLTPLAGTVLTGAAGVGGLAAACGGLILLGRIGKSRSGDSGDIRLIDFVETVGEQAGYAESDQDINVNELLLDDPIAPLDPDSRVVRLFQPEQPPEPLPEPGEMVARIATFLNSGRGAAHSVAEAVPVRADANTALHAALADIRRSLR